MPVKIDIYLHDAVYRLLSDASVNLNLAAEFLMHQLRCPDGWSTIHRLLHALPEDYPSRWAGIATTATAAETACPTSLAYVPKCSRWSRFQQQWRCCLMMMLLLLLLLQWAYRWLVVRAAAIVV
jgi:hypothetical protein